MAPVKPKRNDGIRVNSSTGEGRPYASLADVFTRYRTYTYADTQNVSVEGREIFSRAKDILDKLKRLTRRDNETRLRACNDLHELITQQCKGYDESSEDEKQKLVYDILTWFPEFCRMYRVIVYVESEGVVRLHLHECLRSLIPVLRNNFTQFLRCIFPVLWLSCFDAHAPVAVAARDVLSLFFTNQDLERRFSILNYNRSEISHHMIL